MPRQKACAEPKAAPGMHPAYYQLHALLQSVRQLASHEDEICTLLTELQHRGKPTAALRREIGALLHELPLDALHGEAEGVTRALEPAA